MNSENPYLRLRSYTETDAQYFKGRESESGEIFDLLQRNDVVVLYSESAEGKSSILAAGLYPRLRRHNFLPVSIVFTEDEFAEKSPDFDALILGRIRQAMAEANPGGREPLAPDFGRKVNESECFEWVSTSDVEMPQDSESASALTGSAWWMLRDFAIERYGVRVCPVLVFDQFEEVFTRAASAWTDAFFGWLERLFSDNVPEAVGKALDAFPEDEEPEFSTRKDFRTIVSMRNEYMGELDYWGVQRHFLPEFKNSRYCLRALTIDEAEEVLDLRFADRPELKKSVLAALSGVPASKLAEAQRDLPMVPAMLLSVVCGVLCEEKSAQKYLDNLKDGNSAAVDNILWDFYRTSMRECRIGPTMRKYIEDVLVDKGGKRVRTKVDSKALRRIGFRDKILPQLKKKGLVKTSRINGEDYVELVHDRVAAIIEKSRTRRSSSKQRVAMMFIVILACLIMLFLGTRQQLYSDTLEGHPFAQLNEAGEREVTVHNVSNTLKNNTTVRIARICAFGPFPKINVSNCLKLNTLIISTDTTRSEDIILRISGCPNLKYVYLESESFLEAAILTDERFILVLNPQLQHLEISDDIFGDHNSDIYIVPSTEKSNITNIVNFELLNGILFNNYERSIDHIHGDETRYNNSYYPFPASLSNHSSLRYGNTTIYQAHLGHETDSIQLDFYFDGAVLISNLTPFYRGQANLNAYGDLGIIYSQAFANCSISSVVFPENLVNIYNSAFHNCKRLKSIDFPDNLDIIDPYAFSGCENIDSMKINSHTQIDANSFPQFTISHIEISEVSGRGLDSLHLCDGAVLNREGYPVLFLRSFTPSDMFAEKTDWKYYEENLYAPRDDGNATHSYFKVASLQESEADYLMFYKGLYSPISNEGKVCLYDSIGEMPSLTEPYDVYFNNQKNQDSVIYIDPHMAKHNIRFAVSPDSIRTIHLPFGEPYRRADNYDKILREIRMTQEQMMNTVLYVPYGCADNYNIPEYKWFKEIREDPWIERYLAPLRANLKSIPWWIAYCFIFGSLLLSFLTNYLINRKKETVKLKQILKVSFLSWFSLIIWFIIPFLAAFYLAISYGCPQEKAISAGATAAVVTTSFVIFSPQIIRFVSRIFNRYVIDPLALLFH